MKLIYRISLRLSLVLLPLIALWAVVFYFTMVDEINDEVDDALEDYSELIVIRMPKYTSRKRRRRSLPVFWLPYFRTGTDSSTN